MTDARARKRQLAEMLAETRRHLKVAEQAADAEQRDWRLDGHLLKVAMGVYMLTDCSLDAATMYLDGLANRKAWSAKSGDELCGIVWDAFAATDDELLVTMLSDTSDADYVKAQREAYRHIVKWRTKVWNAEENRKGKLPSTIQLMGRLERERLAIPPNLRPRPYSSKSMNGLRKQGSRLMSQISARYVKEPTKDDLPPSELRTKVASVLQWHNQLCTKACPTKKIVRINWDETAVCLFPGPAKGSLVISKEEFPAKRVPAAAKRTYFTHVALICDDDELQQLLPQVIIGNEHTIKASELEGLQAKCPENVKIMRNNSHWCTGRTCAQIVRMIAAALADHLDVIQVILIFDCHPSHLHDLMWRACHAAMFWPLLVPSKTTKYIQPLDTHCFAIYKVRLQRVYHDAGIRDVDPGINFAALLDSLLITIKDVIFGRSWSHAFSRNGFSVNQAGMQPSRFAKLSFAGPVVFPTSRPTAEQLLACLPKNSTFNTERVWRGVDKVAHTVADIPKLVSEVASVTKADPIATRTRSKAKATAAASTSSSSKS